MNPQYYPRPGDRPPVISNPPRANAYGDRGREAYGQNYGRDADHRNSMMDYGRGGYNRGMDSRDNRSWQRDSAYGYGMGRAGFHDNETWRMEKQEIMAQRLAKWKEKHQKESLALSTRGPRLSTLGSAPAPGQIKIKQRDHDRITNPETSHTSQKDANRSAREKNPASDCGKVETNAGPVKPVREPILKLDPNTKPLANTEHL